MDREISEKKILIQRLKTVAITASIVLGILTVIFLLRHFVQPSVNHKKIRTAKVSIGEVESVIIASGKIISKYEQVLTSPYESRIIDIIRKPGANLKEDDAIIRIDNEDIVTNIKNIEDQIALKRNEMEQLTINFKSEYDDIKSQIEILTLRVEYSAAKTEQQKELHKIKASTTWDVRQAELTENISRIELEQLAASLERKKESTDTRIKGLDISIRLLESDLVVQQKLLENSLLKAESNGVLTWLKEEKGATVLKGEVIAKIADLTSFRVEAQVSDLHSSKFSSGMPVYVEYNNKRVNGHVSTISPNIENGNVSFYVDLENDSDIDLRLNLRTDVYIITDYKESATRIKKGPFINGSGEQEVFIIKGNTAEKRKVEIGLAGVDYYEVITGLTQDEEVIISNMDDYKHLETLLVR